MSQEKEQCFKLNKCSGLDIRKNLLTMKVAKHWNRLSGEVVDVPIPGNIQCQVGRASEHPHLVEDVPAYCRELELDDL